MYWSPLGILILIDLMFHVNQKSFRTDNFKRNSWKKIEHLLVYKMSKITKLVDFFIKYFLYINQNNCKNT